MGLVKDTHLKGQDYQDISMLFYIGFLVAEFPTQYFAQHISMLGRYLGINIMLWGVVLACMASCTSFAGLAICRVFLGIFEACVAPILVLIIAMWYKKSEQGRRVSYFYVCNRYVMISIYRRCKSKLIWTQSHIHLRRLHFLRSFIHARQIRQLAHLLPRHRYHDRRARLLCFHFHAKLADESKTSH